MKYDMYVSMDQLLICLPCIVDGVPRLIWASFEVMCMPCEYRGKVGRGRRKGKCGQVSNRAGLQGPVNM